MNHNLQPATMILIMAFSLAHCASQPAQQAAPGSTTVVQSGESGNKKYYTTSSGMAVQYEVVADKVPAEYRSYKPGPGDVLEILLEDTEEERRLDWWQTNANRERFAGIEFTRYQVTIDPMGNINVPLAGEFHVADLTASEIEQSLKSKLGDYLNNPHSTVKLISYAGFSISVLGEVNKPGRYELKRPITLSEAIALAGGVNRDGTMSRVYLGRRGQKTRPLNVTEVWTSGSLDQEVVLERDDVVFVAPKFWITLPELEQVSTIISNFSNVIWQWK